MNPDLARQNVGPDQDYHVRFSDDITEKRFVKLKFNEKNVHATKVKQLLKHVILISMQMDKRVSFQIFIIVRTGPHLLSLEIIFFKRVVFLFAQYLILSFQTFFYNTRVGYSLLSTCITLHLFCLLMNSLGPDKTRQNISTDLNAICVTHR